MSDRTPIARRARVWGGLAVLLAAGTAPAGAAEWRLNPRLTASESFSDNIRLESGSGQSDFVTQISPGVSLTGTGRRMQVDLDYQLSAVHYLEGTSGRRFDHRLQAGATTEVIKDRVFVDVTSTAGQNNVSSVGRRNLDTVTVDGNRSNFVTFGVTPRAQYRFGRYVNAALNGSVQRVVNSQSVNTTVTSAGLSLSSGRHFTRLPWTLSATTSTNSNSTGSESTFRNVDGSVSYAFSRRYSVRFNAGYSDNDLVGGFGDSSSLTWAITGIWQPTPRTDFQLGYQKQFFGNSVTLSASHRMRRAVVQASYSETVTTSAVQQLERRVIPITDLFGDEIENPGLTPTEIEIDVITLSEEALIDRAFEASLALRLRRGVASVSLFDSRRDLGGRGGEDRAFGTSASLSHSLSRSTSASLSGSWQRSEPGAGREDTLWTLGATLSGQWLRDVSTSLTYRYTDNDSSTPGSSYTENRLSARLSVIF